jgi:hypothetical protein
MKDIVVFTAITGTYDSLKPVNELWARDADFVAFADAAQGPGWSIRPINVTDPDLCRNAKIFKILSHRFFPDVKYSVWVDGSVAIKSTVPIKDFICENLTDHDIAFFKNRRRTCVYVEAMACIKAGKDSPDVICRQMQKYWHEGYPRQNGLAECTVLIRRHSDAILQFNNRWYDEICQHSRRDQLSFNYVATKLGLNYSFLDGTILNNPHFAWYPHMAALRHDRKLGLAITKQPIAPPGCSDG